MSTDPTKRDASPPREMELPAGRLPQILERLSCGYYDTAQVREHVARRIREEWRGSAQAE